MKTIATKIRIQHIEGADMIQTTNWEDFQFLDMPHDREGFELRHFVIGTKFRILENEFGHEGSYEVVDIETYIYDQHDYGRFNAPDGSYQWGFEVLYIVKPVR